MCTQRLQWYKLSTWGHALGCGEVQKELVVGLKVFSGDRWQRKLFYIFLLWLYFCLTSWNFFIVWLQIWIKDQKVNDFEQADELWRHAGKCSRNVSIFHLECRNAWNIGKVLSGLVWAKSHQTGPKTWFIKYMGCRKVLKMNEWCQSYIRM